jgi:hypothetical protein
MAQTNKPPAPSIRLMAINYYVIETVTVFNSV